MTVSIRVLRWTVFFAISTMCTACSGPDFLAALPGQSDADTDDARPEAESFVNCNNCGDPAAVTDAGVDGVVDGAPGTPLTADAVSGNAASTDAATSPPSNEAASTADATASTDAIVEATTMDDTASIMEAGDSAQDSSIENGATGDTGMSCGGGTPTLCAALCVDTTSDSSNCGGCGTACTGGHSCVQSACTCPAGALDCGGTCTPCSVPPTGGVNVCSGSTCTFACTGSGLTKCGSSCTDIMSDQNNCGACGHPCQGGSCTGGQCQPVTLGSFSYSTPVLAINSTTAYAGITSNSCLIEKCPLTGCTGTGAGLVTTLSFSQFGFAPNVLANDSGVFWLGGDGSISGYVNGAEINYLAAPTNTSTMPWGAAIAIDSSNIYWTTNSTPYKVMSCPIVGCPGAGPSTLETGTTPTFITAASGYVYWSDGNKPTKLMKCPAAGCGTSPTVLGTSPASVTWLARAADSANVYFVETTGSGGGSVLQCGVSGCPSNGPITLGTAPSSYLAVDTNSVYWITSGAIVKCAIGGCGGNVTTVITSNTVSTQDPILAVDATSIYWLNGATLMKVAK